MAGKWLASGRIAAWVIVDDSGDVARYYRGSLFELAERWSPTIDEAIVWFGRRPAELTMSDYIDRRIEPARIVPIWVFPDDVLKRIDSTAR